MTNTPGMMDEALEGWWTIGFIETNWSPIELDLSISEADRLRIKRIELWEKESTLRSKDMVLGGPIR